MGTYHKSIYKLGKCYQKFKPFSIVYIMRTPSCWTRSATSLGIWGRTGLSIDRTLTKQGTLPLHRCVRLASSFFCLASSCNPPRQMQNLPTALVALAIQARFPDSCKQPTSRQHLHREVHHIASSKTPPKARALTACAMTPNWFSHHWATLGSNRCKSESLGHFDVKARPGP